MLGAEQEACAGKQEGDGERVPRTELSGDESAERLASESQDAGQGTEQDEAGRVDCVGGKFANEGPDEDDEEDEEQEVRHAGNCRGGAWGDGEFTKLPHAWNGCLGGGFLQEEKGGQGEHDENDEGKAAKGGVLLAYHQTDGAGGDEDAEVTHVIARLDGYRLASVDVEEGVAQSHRCDGSIGDAGCCQTAAQREQRHADSEDLGTLDDIVNILSEKRLGEEGECVVEDEEQQAVLGSDSWSKHEDAAGTEAVDQEVKACEQTGCA